MHFIAFADNNAIGPTDIILQCYNKSESDEMRLNDFSRKFTILKCEI